MGIGLCAASFLEEAWPDGEEELAAAGDDAASELAD